MRKRDPERPFVISIHCSDFHLWDTPPAYRENEPDWWKAQQRPIDQLKALQEKHHNVPIVFGGDLFDRWKPSPELLNWALKHLPVMYGIPGNHDLPNHRYEDIHKSGYWTMVEANRIIDLKPGVPHYLNGLTLYGYPFGSEIKSIASNNIIGFNVAVIHAYVWRKGHSYSGATDDHKASQVERKLGNFSHAFYGDNHSAFTYVTDYLALVNTGCLMRRRRDESAYNPRVWLLWSDGEFSSKKLDCSEDVYTGDEGTTVERGQEIDVGSLVGSLTRLKTTSIDFRHAVDGLMDTLNVSKEVRAKVMESLESRK